MTAFVADDPAGYEVFMGRWTSRLAGPFLEFADIGRGQRVRDVGCIGYPDAAFDAVMSTLALDVIPDAERAAVRAAYPGGMADGPRSSSVIVRAAKGLVPQRM
jgi:hypothetical protein